MAMILWGTLDAASDQTMATITETEGTQFRAALEDLLETIAAGVIANDPAIIEAAEEAVRDALASEIRDANLVSAYPKTPTRYTTFPSIPMKWRHTPYTDPYSDTYEDEYVANFSDGGVSYGDVPVLRPDGKLDASVIPDGFATEAYVDDAIAAIEPTPPNPGGISDEKLPSVFWARVAKARAEETPVAIVWTGSSSTIGPDRYVGPTTLKLQETLWPEMTPTPVQQDQGANFTETPTPGLHGYSAGHGGTTAQTYLTQAEMDRIAALKPAVIAHMVGSNDYTKQQSPVAYKASIKSNIAYLNSKLDTPAVHVLFHAYAIPDFTPWAYSMDQYGQALREIAAEMGDGVIFADLAHEYKKVGIPGADPLLLVGPDRVHQTLAGYAFMAILVLRVLLP